LDKSYVNTLITEIGEDVNNDNKHIDYTFLNDIGIDTQKGLINIAGNEEDYLKLLRTFYNSNFNNIDILNSYLKNDDIKDFGILVHGIKSACANIGAIKLSDNAYSFEYAAKMEDVKYIMDNINCFIEELTILCNNIKIFIEKLKDSKIKQCGSFEYFYLCLDRMRDFLKDYNIKESQLIFNDICNFTWGEKIDSILDKIEVLFDNYETSEILEKVIQLQSKK
jgi:HPt (histidine-containing phosphotransfer) domain-containing protein